MRTQTANALTNLRTYLEDLISQRISWRQHINSQSLARKMVCAHGAIVANNVQALSAGYLHVIVPIWRVLHIEHQWMDTGWCFRSNAHTTSPAAPAPEKQLVASACTWPVRRCATRPQVPLHILKHDRQISSAIGSSDAAGVANAADIDGTTADPDPSLLSPGPLQWRLCDLRLNSVRYPLEHTGQRNFEPMSSSVDRCLKASALQRR